MKFICLNYKHNNKWVQRNHYQILLCKIPIEIIQQVQLNIVLNQMLYHITDKNIPCAQNKFCLSNFRIYCVVKS